MTPTFVCTYTGTTSLGGRSQAGIGNIFYKKVTTGSTQSLDAVFVYLAQGAGKIMVAVYDGSSIPNHLLASASGVYSVKGWNRIPLGYTVSAGTYWIAVEPSGTGQVLYNMNGTDKYQYHAYGSFPNPAIIQAVFGDMSIYASFCQ